MSHSGKLPKLHTPKVPVHMLPVTCLSGKMHGDTLLQGCSLALSLSLSLSGWMLSRLAHGHSAEQKRSLSLLLHPQKPTSLSRFFLKEFSAKRGQGRSGGDAAIHLPAVSWCIALNQ